MMMPFSNSLAYLDSTIWIGMMENMMRAMVSRQIFCYLTFYFETIFLLSSVLK